MYFQQFQCKIPFVECKFCTAKQILQENVVFWKNLHSWHKFYMTAGRDGRDKSQLCVFQRLSLRQPNRYQTETHTLKWGWCRVSVTSCIWRFGIGQLGISLSWHLGLGISLLKGFLATHWLLHHHINLCQCHNQFQCMMITRSCIIRRKKPQNKIEFLLHFWEM